MPSPQRPQTMPSETITQWVSTRSPNRECRRGKRLRFVFKDSKIFPGTTREITVYVPAQYKGDKPACVYVGLDALIFNLSVVFDNLLNKGEMPVTIAIGIKSGVVESANGKENPRLNRSFEFDALNGSLARCIVEEIFPEVEKHKTPDGLPIMLSEDPNDRCTGGASTGGIGAFTLAWERPDLFRRVFSSVGTFVGMRGGDRYPVLVRKTEPKPIRVFQQDGSNDEWMGGPEVGDWWMSNQTLDRLADIFEKNFGRNYTHAPGSGAAGGLGFGLQAFLGAQTELGFDLFARQAKLQDRLGRKHLVITSEGSLDHSTLTGKGVGQIAHVCRRLNIPCLTLAGMVLENEKVQRLFKHAYALVDLTTLANAKSKPAHWLQILSQKTAANLSCQETITGDDNHAFYETTHCH